MKKNKTNSNIILFFLFIILIIASVFLRKKTIRETEGFLAPGTQEGGAEWDGKAWNFINKNHSTVPWIEFKRNNGKWWNFTTIVHSGPPPIDLNTEGAILGEMNNLQLLPSEIKNNLHGDSYKAGLLQVQRVTRPPPPPPPPPPHPPIPFHWNNSFKNFFQNQAPTQPPNPFMNLFQRTNPFQQQQQQQVNTWNSIFRR